MKHADIERMLGERLAAIKAGDIGRERAIREELRAAGIAVEDTAHGTRWRVVEGAR